MTIRNILLVDPDVEFRRRFGRFLRNQEVYSIWEEDSGATCLEKDYISSLDMILFENSLSKPSPWQALSVLRAEKSYAPIILLAEADDEDVLTTGLDNGAIDVFVKDTPFSVLLARVRAHMRSYERHDSVPVDIGPFRFCAASRTLIVRKDQRLIRVPEKEANMLKFLTRSPGNWASARQLLEEVWGYSSHVDSHTLQTHVWRLRKKLRLGRNSMPMIIAENQGYRLLA